MLDRNIPVSGDDNSERIGVAAYNQKVLGTMSLYVGFYVGCF